MSGVFAAVVCAATLVLRIPVPATSGYINLGDSMVFVSALLYGTRVGGIAGGVGSAMADLIGGYGAWAPFTFVIKGVEGFVVGHLSRKNSVLRSVGAVIVGGCIMVSGYLLVETFLYGLPNALVELPFNIFQATFGLAVAVPLTEALKKAMPDRFP